MLKGRIQLFDVFAGSLEGNPLKDPSIRTTPVYLPPGYDQGTERYPVVYFLHGFTGTGLQWLAIERPQLVLSDVQLPGRDGLALFDEIRVRHPSLPVILLTAHGTIPDAVEATSRGVFSYLTKPFDGKALLDKISQALALSTPSSDTHPAEGEACERPRQLHLAHDAAWGYGIRRNVRARSPDSGRAATPASSPPTPQEGCRAGIAGSSRPCRGGC